MKGSFRRHRVAVRPARLRYRSRSAARGVKPFLSILVLAGGLWWVGGAARDWWHGMSFFRVARVVLPADAPEGLDRALAVSAGDPLFGFSSREATRRLGALFPELASVRVRRAWDGSVRVAVQRRLPLARIWRDGQWYGMDAAGGLFPMRIFGPEDAPAEQLEGKGLVILAGELPAVDAAAGVLAFAGLVGKLPQSWARGFYKMKLDPAGQSLIYLKDGPVVLWGDPAPDEDRTGEKAERLERVLKDERLAGGAETVRFVDDRRLAVKLKMEPEKAAAPRRNGRPSLPGKSTHG